ncbi:hypothetical protein H4R19_000554 [Coemansia spiralis]|nr:hypothetical protein H4R19_000554 [Coemansia spiralis]
MPIADLPDDILIRVLAEALDRSNPDCDFRHRLPLLGVCRRWRCLALADVYSRVDVFCDEDTSGFGGFGWTNAPQSHVISNASLVAASGYTGLAKHTRINSFTSTERLDNIDRVVDVMQAAAAEWSAMQSLEINAYMHSTFLDDDDGVEQHRQELDNIARSLAKLMPAVRRLEFGHQNFTPLARALSRRVVEPYAVQLEILRCDCPYFLSPSYSFPRLREARINFEEAEGHLRAYMNPATLVKLDISSVLLDQSWSEYRAHGDSQTIEFPVLEYLTVDYAGCDGYDADGWADKPAIGTGGWQLRFPAAKMVSIRCPNGACPVLQQAAFPPKLDELRITGNGPMFEYLARQDLPVARRLVLQIDASLGCNASVIAPINRVLARARQCEEMALRLGASWVDVMPSTYLFAGLHRLSISAPLCGDGLLLLMVKLPQLLALTIDRLTTTSEQAAIHIPPGGHFSVDPFDTRLRRLSVCMDHDNYTDKHAEVIACYLVLRAPPTTRLVLSKVPKEPVLRFVEEYSEWHSHLRTVAFTINNSP